MTNESSILSSADIEKIIIDLQVLGMDLKNVIFKLSESAIKEYLLLETSKIIEFKKVLDFYYLQNKILRMIDMVTRWNLDSKILKLLEEINFRIRKIVRFIEREREE
jgi:hypothetical protein